MICFTKNSRNISDVQYCTHTCQCFFFWTFFVCFGPRSFVVLFRPFVDLLDFFVGLLNFFFCSFYRSFSLFYFFLLVCFYLSFLVFFFLVAFFSSCHLWTSGRKVFFRISQSLYFQDCSDIQGFPLTDERSGFLLWKRKCLNFPILKNAIRPKLLILSSEVFGSLLNNS